MSVKDELLDHAFSGQAPNQLRNIVYAGFWVRVLATIVDVIVQLPFFLLNMYNTFKFQSLVLSILILIGLMVYKPAMEYLYGATLGKMALKIKVVTTDLESISLNTAIMRYSPWLLSSIAGLFTTVMMFTADGFSDIAGFMELGQFQQDLGYQTISSLLGLLVLVSGIWVVFNNKKQGLHDLIAGTYCIENK